jgi:hypothetical protein
MGENGFFEHEYSKNALLEGHDNAFAPKWGKFHCFGAAIENFDAGMHSPAPTQHLNIWLVWLSTQLATFFAKTTKKRRRSVFCRERYQPIRTA